jgi:hypothetical protein
MDKHPVETRCGLKSKIRDAVGKLTGDNKTEAEDSYAKTHTTRPKARLRNTIVDALSYITPWRHQQRRPDSNYIVNRSTLAATIFR